MLLKKFKDQISFQKRKEIAEDLSLWPIISPTRHLFLKAIRFQQHHHLSWWDSLVVVSAIEAKADYLVTEDLNPGQSYESVQVLNPFILEYLKCSFILLLRIEKHYTMVNAPNDFP